MRIAFGTDEDGALAGAVVGHLADRGEDVDVVARPARWPEVGRDVGEKVASGQADMGIVCCWTGTGVCMAANKVKGVRAALCSDAPTASGARRWNDANVLALSIRSVSEAVAFEIVDAFLAGQPDPGEADAIAAIE
ncbi:MAG: RpiB/LacA/LacB family sugar-phosphate isomerase [Acidimicrobiales bacterium]|nr:RpiB/LacA/LacB family sugar-phosphate isomerase [Acidimicrobiales bacterium]